MVCTNGKRVSLISLLYMLLLFEAEAIVEQMWSVCPKRQAINTTLQSSPTAGLTQCVNECMGNSHCKSGHIYQEDDGTKTCSLSSDWSSDACDDLTVNGKCIAFKLINPCQHEGTLNPDGQSCSCVNHWYDRYCQRYGYDCSEFGTGVTILQPRGSSRSFTMTCAPNNMVIGLRTSSLLPGELNRTFAAYKASFFTGSGSGWMGLDVMHALTQQGEYRLTVQLNPLTNKISVYDDFKVNGVDQGYSFSYQTFRGDLSNYWDGFAAHPWSGIGNLVGQPFSTYDNDLYGCAALLGAGWWYDAHCGPVLPWVAPIKNSRWRSTPFAVVNVPWMTFDLELQYYY